MLGTVTSSLPRGPSSEHKGGFVPLPHARAGCDPARGLGVLPGGLVLRGIDVVYFLWILGLGSSRGWMFAHGGHQALWDSGVLAASSPVLPRRGSGCVWM